MFQLKNDTSSYFDFKLVYDKISEKEINDYLKIKVDFSETLMSVSGTTQNSDVTLIDVTLNGLDNFLIPNGIIDGEIDSSISYDINTGDRFKFNIVSGYTKNINYDIADVGELKKLNGGFYQGFFKLHEYPVDYFESSISKGWSANITLFHNPTEPDNDLNTIFPDNEGFIFYLGTRAENKYNDITDIELEKIKENYDVEFSPVRTTLFTRGGEFTLDGEPYEGKYNYLDGQYWTGYVKTEDSERLIKIYHYDDVKDNAFGIRIHPDGRIGYRLLTDVCNEAITTGTTATDYIWEEVYDCKTDSTLRKLVTPEYKLIEQYSKEPVMNDKINKYVNIFIVFERYFPVTSICQLKYSNYRKGILKIFVNGVKVLSAQNVDEVFSRELDTIKELQQAVPYSISIGGGTQGLYEAVYLDPNKEIDGVLEKYFAGTYTGSLKNFSFYTTPANVTMIRNKTIEVLSELNIPITFGGRKIILY